MDKSIILLIPEKTDIEFEEVFATWIKYSGQIKRLGKYWVKDEDLIKKNCNLWQPNFCACVSSNLQC
jgi:hypothetical protein